MGGTKKSATAKIADNQSTHFCPVVIAAKIPEGEQMNPTTVKSWLHNIALSLKQRLSKGAHGRGLAEPDRREPITSYYESHGQGDPSSAPQETPFVAYALTFFDRQAEIVHRLHDDPPALRKEISRLVAECPLPPALVCQSR